MNFRQLETFYWASKLGSLSAAAERLNATQSTVSMRIIELERELGVELFDRSQRAARTTAKGRELIYYAEKMLRLLAEMEERVGGTGATQGVLRLGVAEMISITWLPRLVQVIHEKYPRVTLELDEALTKDLVERFTNGSLDMILAPGKVPGYSVTPVPLGRVQFAWMASPSFGMPSGVLTPRDLQAWPVIALSRESYHHTSIEEWFRLGNVHCRRIDTCKSFGVASSLASAGLGVTLLPPRCYKDEIKTGKLRLIETDPPFPPVEFAATAAVESMQPAAKQITLLAREISDFEKD
ncbi:MAG: LysR family transcriptional regulator [Hyphomicrobiaceae bacterium]|nr:LysR family transcriptional regulator [Hyphomicrobiaceae bacterium]